MQSEIAASDTDEIPIENLSSLTPMFSDLLKALDTDNPLPAEIMLHKLAKQLPAKKLDTIWTDVRNFDFRSAEANTQLLAKELGIPLNDRPLSGE